jgi:hypothetical protein
LARKCIDELLIGATFNRWTVLAICRHPGRNPRFLVRCACGAERESDASSVKTGRSKSCGCLSAETTALRNAASAQHGHKRAGIASRTYKSWEAMRARCEEPSNRSFRFYGARGIRVCSEWQSFAQFLADMGERPAGTTLDRREVNGNYEKANCRWADSKTQGRENKRCLKLDADKAAEIRRRFVRGSGPALAAEFGVSESNVYLVQSGATWA